MTPSAEQTPLSEDELQAVGEKFAAWAAGLAPREQQAFAALLATEHGGDEVEGYAYPYLAQTKASYHAVSPLQSSANRYLPDLLLDLRAHWATGTGNSSAHAF